MSLGKVALITGGARGIGNAIACALAAEGYGIAIMDVLDEAAAAAGLHEIMVAGCRCVEHYKGSIASREDRQNVVSRVMEKSGRIDVLVNNAGVAPRMRMDILDTTDESFDFVLGTNLKGTFFLTQLVANIMIEEIRSIVDIKPIIVNISSMSAYTSSIQRGEYCISKAGVSMVTALFTDRLAEYGICVFEIRPGIISTEMTSGVKAKYDKMIENGLMPIKRWGSPRDVADAVVVLCSGKLAFSTGDIINVDGGYHLRRL